MIILIFITSWMTVFGQNTEFKPKYSVVLEGINGKKLLSQCSRETPKNISEFWQPTNNDIQNLENNFLKIKKIKSTGCCFSGIVISELDKYGFQYIGVVIKNKKYIYINAFGIFSDEDVKTIYKNWLNEAIIFCDGGEGFWGVLYDINEKKFIQLHVNGVA